MSTPYPHVREQRFRWAGLTGDGMRRRGTLIAIDAGAARVALKRAGITALRVEARGQAPRAVARTRDLTVFTRQLASLLRAGLPLAAALDLLARGAGAMPRITAGLARAITAGASLSNALRGRDNSIRCICN